MRDSLGKLIDGGKSLTTRQALHDGYICWSGDFFQEFWIDIELMLTQPTRACLSIERKVKGSEVVNAGVGTQRTKHCVTRLTVISRALTVLECAPFPKSRVVSSYCIRLPHHEAVPMSLPQYPDPVANIFQVVSHFRHIQVCNLSMISHSKMFKNSLV
jgi:hypothetical protein